MENLWDSLKIKVEQILYFHTVSLQLAYYLSLYSAMIKASKARWSYSDGMWKYLPIALSISYWNEVLKLSFIHIYTMCPWGVCTYLTLPEDL